MKKKKKTHWKQKIKDNISIFSCMALAIDLMLICGIIGWLIDGNWLMILNCIILGIIFTAMGFATDFMMKHFNL